MSLPLPSALSPSKVSSFKDCALAFRFSAIDRLPEPPSPWTVKGNLVHHALEQLFWLVPAGQRTLAAGLEHLDQAWGSAREEPDLAALALTPTETDELRADTERLVRGYFELEDPDLVTAVGVELALEADLGDLRLRGVIDRLDIDRDGRLVVTDYKTGRVPGQAQEQLRLAGVHFYAFLCEQVLGERPARVQLLYLREPLSISTIPSDQSMQGLRRRTSAIWSAIERACALEDFRPKPSALCEYCNWQEYCPAFGGDPARAVEVRGQPTLV
ncbi:MAG TPA: PD-(D/E)XK nuclease family protein [Acidimicrobiales bacterium]|jgi:putative RecB family exonuclease|nr:PD-(D/E)XK nuclease family protein [Acidimicrobiales bacterium]